MGCKSVAGSVIGGLDETQELIDFCGGHGITPDILWEITSSSVSFVHFLCLVA